MEIKNKDQILEYIKSGLRLNTPAPRIEKDPTKYTRKDKHKKKYQEKDDDN